uniref:Uncharacterized protein n=1 Tax=Rhizophora mucronata TaxID=61149 RepID=A0A2P2PNU7_RHIMU
MFWFLAALCSFLHPLGLLHLIELMMTMPSSLL